MGKLFGTDGIRGEVNRPPLKPGIILGVGRALGAFWEQVNDSSRVIIGHDGRLSADYIQNLLAGALQGIGYTVEKIGLTSTPGLASVTAKRDSAGGIMISASHNPYYDNGIKPFQSTGEKFTDDQEMKVEEFIESDNAQLVLRKDIGVTETETSPLQNYIDTVVDNFAGTFDSSVLIDCANGGCSRLAPAIFEEICEEVTFINNSPDGLNINREAGSLHLENVKQKKDETGANLAFALDGDGDRLLGVDETGEVVDGDSLIYMLGRALKKDQRLNGGLVITEMSNLGLRRALERDEIEYRVVGVGDRKVYRELLNCDWYLGGEQSGHIINRHHLPTGDGLNTLISVLDILNREDKALAEYNELVARYPQVLHNIEVETKPPLEELETSRERIETVEQKLGREGRVLVRYSGTEPVARIMLEGKDEVQLQEFAEDIGRVMIEEIESYT